MNDGIIDVAPRAGHPAGQQSHVHVADRTYSRETCRVRAPCSVLCGHGADGFGSPDRLLHRRLRTAERLLSHRIFVSARSAGGDTYAAVGLLDWQSQTLIVPARS